MDVSIVGNIAKIATVTLFTGAMTKAIGQKEMSSCINMMGIITCGLLVMQGLQPFINGIGEFSEGCTNFFNGFANFVDAIMFWR